MSKTDQHQTRATRTFVIIGLPRSGTTYLMTLLNSHPAIHCAGEQYNPYAVIGASSNDDSHDAVVGRDRDPVGFLDRFLGDAEALEETHVGFKFMLGHNLAALEALMARPDVTLIYVWRENRLAQASSWIKAEQTLNWAQTQRQDNIRHKIDVRPRDLSRRWHEMATLDYLFSRWFDAAPHTKIKLEYRTLFTRDFNAAICDFLGVPTSRRMKSPLVKQNPNTVLDRFVEPRHINYYFRQMGKAHWLGPEL